MSSATLRAATDRAPDNTAGAQVHLLYVPGDAAERFAEFEDSIADDAALIDSWWRAQDFSRTVRFDTYGFPSCGAGGGVEISLVGLAQPGGTFANDSTRFGAVSAALRGAGWPANGKKYLVH